jgi:hypothetical protein
LTGLGKTKLTEAGKLWQEAQQRFDHVFGRKNSETLGRILNRISSADFKSQFVQPA